MILRIYGPCAAVLYTLHLFMLCAVLGYCTELRPKIHGLHSVRCANEGMALSVFVSGAVKVVLCRVKPTKAHGLWPGPDNAAIHIARLLCKWLSALCIDNRDKLQQRQHSHRQQQQQQVNSSPEMLHTHTHTSVVTRRSFIARMHGECAVAMAIPRMTKPDPSRQTLIKQ